MIWLSIKGYDGEYQLSQKGDLRRLANEGYRLVKSCRASNGKLYVTLWKHGVRKNYMLHNLYSETFKVSVGEAEKILYEGYEGSASAKDKVRKWLLQKISESEQQKMNGEGLNDEILYLKSFLEQLTD